MARYSFGGGVADWSLDTVTVSGTANLAQVAGGATITFWTAETGGSQYTDILDSDGAAVTVIESADGTVARAAGQIPPLQGPDEVREMWASANDGPRALLVGRHPSGSETPAGAQAKADAAQAAAQAAAAAAALLASVHDPYQPSPTAPVMAAPPTVTYSSSEPTGMASAYYADGTLLPAITTRGLLVADRTVSGNVGMINACAGYIGSLPTVTSAALYPPYWVEFDLYGDTFVLQTISLTAAYRLWLWVDGSPVTATPSPMSSIAVGGFTQTTVAFGSTKLRRVRVLVPGFVALRRIYYPVTGSVTPTGKTGKTVAIVGDSWVEGSGATSSSSALPVTLELLTGLEVYGMGQAGTGYTNPGGGAGQTQGVFGDPTRLAALAQIQPDYILVHGSSNDDGASDSALTAAATSYYAALAATCPAAKVVVIGPQDVTSSHSATRLAKSSAVLAAAAAAPNVVKVVSPLDWITGTGSSTSPTGSGIADWANNGAAVGHLTQAGYDYWARRIAAVVREVITDVT